MVFQNKIWVKMYYKLLVFVFIQYKKFIYYVSFIFIKKYFIYSFYIYVI